MGTNKRLIAAWAMMIALLLASASLPARERKGARVVVEQNDGATVSGELLMVKSDGLVIENRAGGVIVDLSAVRSVRIQKKSKAGAGLLIGFLGGTLIGFGISSSSQESNGVIMDVGLTALFIGLPAGCLGALTGVVAGKDLILNPGKMEQDRFLVRLNRYARVPDASLSPGQ